MSILVFTACNFYINTFKYQLYHLYLLDDTWKMNTYGWSMPLNWSILTANLSPNSLAHRNMPDTNGMFLCTGILPISRRSCDKNDYKIDENEEFIKAWFGAFNGPNSKSVKFEWLTFPTSKISLFHAVFPILIFFFQICFQTLLIFFKFTH